MKKVLIIEDDRDISDLISLHLKDLGCQTEKETNGKIGLERALAGKYDLYVLDIMLPGIDGMEICKRIRSEKIRSPILMLTAKSEEFDKVLGLELGADDYLTKPFSLREFIARVKAIFRRIETDTKPIEDETVKKKIQFGSLSIDAEKRKVELGKNEIELTAKEFDLLFLFASHPGRCYSRAELLNIIWGYQFEGYDHTVNSHINRLRAKIEKNPENPTYIKTVWGVGYKFAEESETKKK
ncbi:MAG: response regulator transcription factor [Ignavibacteriales bacterium]|nr:response regulator transcription factor [Ignavibacteriales bacterium]